MVDPSQIQTRYAKSGELNIAYQLFGSGGANLVVIPGWASNVENIWTVPEIADFAARLAEFASVIVLDRRGTGLSDPVVNPPTLEERMDDVRAVMDSAGWKRAAIWGISEGGPMAMTFAASHPDRVDALVLYGTYARFSRADDYPHGYPAAANAKWLADVESTWGTGTLSRSFAPSKGADPETLRNLARLERLAMSPGTALKLFTLQTEFDVRHVLPAIRVPTLILHRKDDRPVRVQNGRYLAERIAGAKYVELEGTDHLVWLGDMDSALAEVREFLTGERATAEPDRVLATILFCDIVDSTAHAASLGDHNWKQLLSRFHALADEKLRHFRGRKLDTAGDGLYAAFDGPARAARCGAALANGAEGLGVRLRVGVHTGECEVLEDKYSGIAVHVGARIAALASPGEVLVSSTVKDLVAGSGLRFEDRGEHVLKGVPGQWRLFAAA
ncbi:MAG TPA: adenylate/guanylate cyclase domain-containing protein [Burkholderiales bacterium]|nr:adenylate/guanylate cyclase domain-containing protein [Burkholderiales bacterium]